MKIIKYALIFVLGVILATAMMFLELPFWFIYVSVVVIYLLLLVAPQMYTVYKSKNLNKIEQYLEKNKRKPIFAYPLALKTGDQEQIVRSIEEILKRHKQPYMQEVYKTMLALFENNVSKFEQLAKQISKEPLRTYYIAYAEALKGNFDEANTLKNQLPKEWMQHAIAAVIAKQQDNIDLFEKEVNICIDLAKGVQKYSLYYSFQLDTY
ncbi:hypothetical protein NSQ95_02815 [Psychrobacillus sp. FSL W7-1457]|uniref:hypothetical protein n=1 Tax=Psychrobacillus sp. FSL W7-1457 TaxID=2954547 RepID=UPI00315A4E2C